MTSASELFYNWRSRAGRVSSMDPDASVLRSVYSDRGLAPRPRRRRGLSRRREDGGAGRGHPRSPRSHRWTYQSEYVSGTGNESILGSSNRIDGGTAGLDRLSLNRSERLPGAVLQARARVLERLRGISIAGGRASLSWDELEETNVFRVIDIGNRESRRDRHDLAQQFNDLTLELDEPSSFQTITANKRPPGLSKEAISLLKLEVCKSGEESNKTEGASIDCSICLERFCEGDEVVRLSCGHRFHPNCLEPWVRKCGDCPYCRTAILT